MNLHNRIIIEDNNSIEDLIGDEIKEKIKIVLTRTKWINDPKVQQYRQKICDRIFIEDNNSIEEKHSGSNFDKNDPCECIEQEDLPKGKPLFMEIHSSFEISIGSNMNVNKILRNLKDFFEGNRVDFEFFKKDSPQSFEEDSAIDYSQMIEEKCFFKCSHVHENYYQLIFHVYLYLLDDTVLVEFQRRSGDVVQFMDFYLNVRDQIRDGKKLSTKETQWGSEIPSVGSGDVLDCLKQQIKSDCSGVRLEAMRLLAFLSSAPKNNQPMFDQGIVDILIKMLSKNEEESILRCTASTVANLAKHDGFNEHEKMRDKGVIDLLCQFAISLLEKGISFREKESLREVMRALSKILKKN